MHIGRFVFAQITLLMCNSILTLMNNQHILIGIGDNDNDLSMFKKTGLSFCVGNGCDNAREAADILCPVDNNHDAVAWVINRYVFGEEC